jgi:hypothetical protein
MEADEFELKRQLDANQHHVLIVRFRMNMSNHQIESFAVIHVHISTKDTAEIAKVDGSLSERVNIHHSYRRPPTKEYHQRPLTIETIEHYIQFLTEHWQWHFAQYKENYI